MELVHRSDNHAQEEACRMKLGSGAREVVRDFYRSSCKTYWRVGTYNFPFTYVVSCSRTTTLRSRQRWILGICQGGPSSYHPMRRNFKVKRLLLLGRSGKFGDIAVRSHKCKEDAKENRVMSPFMSRGANRAMVELNEGLFIVEAKVVALGNPDQVVMSIFF